MFKKIDYFKKYKKYKIKYIMLQNQYSGANLTKHIEFIDELSINTNVLLTTVSFMKIGWDHYSIFENLVNSFGIRIVILKTVSPEWGQDFVKSIKIDREGGPTFQLVTRHVHPMIVEELENTFPEFSFNIIALPKNTNEYNLIKGGNFITFPNTLTGVLPNDDFEENPIQRTKKVITLVPEEHLFEDHCIYTPFLCLKVYLPGFDINSDYGDDVFHIDEILTLIPTGPGVEDYDVWFYHPVCLEDQDYHQALQEIFNYNYDLLRRFIPTARIKLFNLHFTRDGKLVFPPIFNRVLLRKDNRFRIIFPDQENPGLKQQVINEMTTIIQRYPYIDYHFINTKKLHNLNGNIHCGFKNIPEI